jgi:hypothetical protein
MIIGRQQVRLEFFALRVHSAEKGPHVKSRLLRKIPSPLPGGTGMSRQAADVPAGGVGMVSQEIDAAPHPVLARNEGVGRASG